MGEFRRGGSATNGANLSCFQGSRLTPNSKSPRTGLFNRIELVQGLPLGKFGAAPTFLFTAWVCRRRRFSLPSFWHSLHPKSPNISHFIRWCGFGGPEKGPDTGLSHCCSLEIGSVQCAVCSVQCSVYSNPKSPNISHLIW